MFGNSWFKKEKPILGIAGFGGGATSVFRNSGGPSALASGGYIAEPGNGYVYHTFDGAADIYSSPGANDTTFANFTLDKAGFGDMGVPGATPTAGSWCLVLDGRAQETVDLRNQNTQGPSNGTYSIWYSTDNGVSFSPHPSPASGTMNGGTQTTIGPHPSPFGGVTHVIYSDGTPTSNRNYWCPTPGGTFSPTSPTALTCDIIAVGGGGAGGSSGGGAGGVIYYTGVPIAGDVTLVVGRGGTSVGGGAAGPGSISNGALTSISGPDFPATITCWGGGGGGAFNSPPYPDFNGGSGGGGYSSAGGSNTGPGGTGEQPTANPTYSPSPSFTNYGNDGSGGNTKIGYIYGGAGGGAGAAGESFPSPTAPNSDYETAHLAEGGDGQAFPGFEYALWEVEGRDLGPEPNNPTAPFSTNEFGGGGGAGSSPGCRGGKGGGGWGGTAYAMASGEPALGGGAGGAGSSYGAGGCGGVIIRYPVA
jgi:hypothetical protein